MRGRPKGGKNKYWSKEEKLRIVKKVINDLRSSYDVAAEEQIAPGMLGNWIIKYNKFGEKGLENQRKPGNPLCKYQNKKNLSREEQLEYENMKLRIELERLKKGYIVKGDGLNKQFISINKKNSK